MSQRTTARYFTLFDAINYWVLVEEIYKSKSYETAHAEALRELQHPFIPRNRLSTYVFAAVPLAKNFQGIRRTEKHDMRDVQGMVNSYLRYGTSGRVQALTNLYNTKAYRAAAEKVYVEQAVDRRKSSEQNLSFRQSSLPAAHSKEVTPQQSPKVADVPNDTTMYELEQTSHIALPTPETEQAPKSPAQAPDSPDMPLMARFNDNLASLSASKSKLASRKEELPPSPANGANVSKGRIESPTDKSGSHSICADKIAAHKDKSASQSPQTAKNRALKESTTTDSGSIGTTAAPGPQASNRSIRSQINRTGDEASISSLTDRKRKEEQLDGQGTATNGNKKRRTSLPRHKSDLATNKATASDGSSAHVLFKRGATAPDTHSSSPEALLMDHAMNDDPNGEVQGMNSGPRTYPEDIADLIGADGMRAAAMKAADNIRHDYQSSNLFVDDDDSTSAWDEPPIKYQWTEENARILDLGECRFCGGFFSRIKGGGLTKHEIYWCILNSNKRDIQRRKTLDGVPSNDDARSEHHNIGQKSRCVSAIQPPPTKPMLSSQRSQHDRAFKGGSSSKIATAPSQSAGNQLYRNTDSQTASNNTAQNTNPTLEGRTTSRSPATPSVPVSVQYSTLPLSSPVAVFESVTRQSAAVAAVSADTKPIVSEGEAVSTLIDSAVSRASPSPANDLIRQTHEDAQITSSHKQILRVARPEHLLETQSDWDMIEMYLDSGCPAADIVEMVNDTLKASWAAPHEPRYAQRFLQHFVREFKEELLVSKAVLVIKYFGVVAMLDTEKSIEKDLLLRLMHMCERTAHKDIALSLLSAYLQLFCTGNRLKLWQYLSKLEDVSLVKRYRALMET